MNHKLNDLAIECHDLAVEKGWYDTERSFPELIALIHGEVSEALQVYREDNSPRSYWEDARGKPEGVPAELADAIMEILSMCAFFEIDIDAALATKMAYNRTRPYRHGNKTC